MSLDATEEEAVVVEPIESSASSVVVEPIITETETTGSSSGVASLDGYTWDEISIISESGQADAYFNVGDTKTVTINGIDYIFEICAFDHDVKVSGGTAGITFGMKGVLETSQFMNSDNTNVNGWSGSALRSYLNGIETTYGNYGSSAILYQLPADLQANIVSVIKSTSGGSNNTDLVNTEDKLFVFCDEEVTGYNYSGSTLSEGSQYSIFSDSNSRIKLTPSGNESWWWMRSANNVSTKSFYGVNKSGDVSSNYAGETFGISFAFSL
jgi:hypothetical protein